MILAAILPRSARVAAGRLLAAAMASEVDSRLAGKSATTSKTLFSNYYTPVYDAFGLRNVNAWCADIVDLTCISPRNSDGGYARAGTLISPDIAIVANHFPISVGASMDFYTMDNIRHRESIISRQRIADSDLLLLRFANPFPSSVKFAKILPATTYRNLREFVGNGGSIPALALDQNENAIVNEWSKVNDFWFNSGIIEAFRAPTDSKRLEFYENLITFDSGNPSFLIYDSQLILMTVWSGGGGGNGSSVHGWKNEINSAMSALGSAYLLTEVLI